jgi:hypothetical protein
MDESQKILETIAGQGGASTPEPEKPDPLAKEKAAFKAILKADSEGSDEATTTRQATAAAKAAKKPKAEKKAETKEAAPAPAEEPKEEAPAAPAAPKAEEKLRAKLLLAGAPKGAVENLSDTDVREWWRVQEERERVQAQALERASAAEKKLQALEGTTSKPAEPQGVPTAELDLDEIAGELADQFGETESGAIMKALEALTAPLRAEIGELQGVINAARKRGVEDISTRNRARLAEKLPHLLNSDRAWSLLQTQVEASARENPTQFSSVDGFYDDAFSAIYGEVQPAEAEPTEPDRSEEIARIEASAPTPPASVKRMKKLTPVEGAFEAFKLLDKDPDDVDGARKLYNRALSA